MYKIQLFLLPRKLEKPPREVVKIQSTQPYVKLMSQLGITKSFSEIYLGFTHIQDDNSQNNLDQGWAIIFH